MRRRRTADRDRSCGQRGPAAHAGAGESRGAGRRPVGLDTGGQHAVRSHRRTPSTELPPQSSCRRHPVYWVLLISAGQLPLRPVVRRAPGQQSRLLCAPIQAASAGAALALCLAQNSFRGRLRRSSKGQVITKQLQHFIAPEADVTPVRPRPFRQLPHGRFRVACRPAVRSNSNVRIGEEFRWDIVHACPQRFCCANFQGVLNSNGNLSIWSAFGRRARF